LLEPVRNKGNFTGFLELINIKTPTQEAKKMDEIKWIKSPFYQARIRCEDIWVRTIGFCPAKNWYLCRSGKEKEIFFADELVEFCE